MPCWNASIRPGCHAGRGWLSLKCSREPNGSACHTQPPRTAVDCDRKAPRIRADTGSLDTCDHKQPKIRAHVVDFRTCDPKRPEVHNSPLGLVLATLTQFFGFPGSKVGHVIIWADGTVTGLRAQWKGAVELTVARRDAEAEVPALVYTDLMAAPAVGDRVLLNVAALERGLGTGGYALVIAVLDAEGNLTAQPPQPSGHLVKARYLPLQAMVAGADEQGSP